MDVRTDWSQRLVAIGTPLTILTAVVAIWLSQRADQKDAQLSREQAELTRQGQITDRFSTAIEQLGSEKPDVRIGGAYALLRIMRDSDDDRPAVIDVLSTYVRSHAPAVDMDETVRTPIPADLQTIVTVLSRRPDPGAAPLPDLSGTNLYNTHLTGANLSYVNLSRADLRDANLEETDLTQANLTDADLTLATLTDANLSRASLLHADLTHANLAGDFTMVGQDLKYGPGANLSGALLSGATLNGAAMAGTDLRGAQLDEAKLVGTDLRQAKLREAGLTYADLTNAAVASADLSRADLSGSVLSGADLSHAILVDANLADANLRGAVLADANLAGANLAGVDLTDVDLSGVDLTSVDLALACGGATKRACPKHNVPRL